jgi:RNA polymerase sigma factor (sigma-70 family)
MDAADAQDLLQRYQQGDEAAAGIIFDRYAARLIALARARLSAKMAARVAPEDIVQSVYRSFFRRAKKGDFVAEPGSDLWRLLAAVTIHKVHKKVDYHQAAKRAIAKEEDLFASQSFGVHPQFVCEEPTPNEAVLISEEVQGLLSELIPTHRQMIELRLEGYSTAEISEKTERTQVQVRRVLKRARDLLEERLLGAVAE